ncbi:MAG: hypothetical protein LBT01_05015 [Spirochaetaceae bacterium]|jgi:tetratricopeptide (TPR) repeat protein|nr:hypothetical protein [Spirochaetaceae bacterium]
MWLMKTKDGKEILYLRVTIISLILALSAAPLFGGGEGDPSLLRADSLIEQKQYNEAIRILGEFAQDNNEQFDDAETRIYSILQARNAYYALINQLIDTLENAPDNIEKVLVLTSSLKQIEIRQTDRERYFIDNIDFIARLALKRRQVANIMKEGRALLDAGKFDDASRKYESGFAIYEGEMEEAQFGAEIEQSARGEQSRTGEAVLTIAEITVPIAQFKNTLSRLGKDADSPRRREDVNTAFQGILPRLDSLIQAKTAFAAAAQFFEKNREQPLIKDSAAMGRYYFPTGALLLDGRPDMGLREGLLGTADALWKSIVIPFDTVYTNTAEYLYTQARNETEKQSRTNDAITAARDFIKNPLALAEKSQAFTDVDSRYPSADYKPDNIPLIDNNIIRFRAMNDTLKYFDDVFALRVAYDAFQKNDQHTKIMAAWRGGELTPDEAYTRVRDNRAPLQKLVEQISKDLDDIDKDSAYFSTQAANAAQEAEKVPVQAGLRYFSDARRLLESAGRGIFADGLSTATDLYAIANVGLENRIQRLEGNYTETVPLMEGLEITTEQGHDVLAHYPREANEIYQSMEDRLKESVSFADDVSGGIEKEPDRFEASPPYKNVESQALTFIEKIRNINVESQSGKETSRDRYLRAESLRDNAERQLSEARQAVRRNDAAGARRQIDESVARLTESLDLQENPEIRRLWLTQLEPLAAEIARVEYADAIKLVREYIDAARRQYFAGDFEQAEQSIMRAENRWAAVRPEPNEEIIYWLTIVRGALSLREGTSIPVTAPLYPQMSQLLNDAQKDYNDGVRFLQSKRREEGLVRFAAAREKTRQVRVIFPLNQEAGTLEMKIDKVIDPASFEQFFRRRFSAAVAGANAGSMESYIELENLSTINPRYPGMQAALSEAAYDVGLKMRPVDKRLSDQATELVNSAQRILDRNARAQYEEALSLVQRALELDPTNTRAGQVRDRVQVAIGSSGSLVSDTASEQEYLRAVREFQQGNGILAMSIVERLLQNPVNRGNVRINELRRRIAATL